MLDPASRKCGLCYEDQQKWGIPIPTCSDPDGDKKPCQYPTVIQSFMEENATAWNIWANWMDQIIRVEPTMAGAIYTLNLDFLIWHLEETQTMDKMSVVKKIKVIFNEWRTIQSSLEQTKTNKSFERTKAMKREHGGR